MALSKSMILALNKAVVYERAMVFFAIEKLASPDCSATEQMECMAKLRETYSPKNGSEEEVILGLAKDFQKVVEHRNDFAERSGRWNSLMYFLLRRYAAWTGVSLEDMPKETARIIQKNEEKMGLAVVDRRTIFRP